MPAFLFPLSFVPILKKNTQVNELPNNGAHIPVVQQAEALMRRIEMEQKATALLDDAMSKRDLNALTSAIAGCDRMAPPMRHQKLDEAREMMVSRLAGCWVCGLCE